MKPPTPSTDAERLAFVVGRLNRRMQSATGGMSYALLSAMAVTAKHGPLRLSDLAQFEGVSAPSMTRTVSELASRGYLVRHPDPADGRAALIAATDSGMAAVLDARAARARLIAELLAGLDEVDAASITAALPALERLTDPT
jgi:DNA-binding MarR family transcriptional regulator